MQFPILSKIAKNEISWLLFVAFSGIACGSLVLRSYSLLTLTSATFLLAAVISPFAVIIVGNTKRFLWAILVVCLPITVDITINRQAHYGGAAGYVISIYDISLAALYVLWSVEMINKKELNIRLYPEISLPAFFLISMSCLSIIPAASPELCVYEIIEVIKMYFTFIYLANNIKTKNDIQFIVCIFIALLLFEGLLGWAQHRTGETLFPETLGGPGWIEDRVKGTWYSYNDFAWYLTFIMPLSLSMTFSSIKKYYKIICFLTLIVAGGTLLWTGSRSGWISFAMACFFVGSFCFLKIKNKKSLINTFLTIIIILILIFPLYPRLFNKIYYRFVGDDRGAAASRYPQFIVAIDIIKHNPILGVGINNYTRVMSEYDKAKEIRYEITKLPVHNIFLHIASEIGIPGICFFLWFIVAIFYEGLSYVILTNDTYMAYAVIGMMAGILAFLVHGLFDTASIGSKMFIFNWFFAGMIFGIRSVKL